MKGYISKMIGFAVASLLAFSVSASIVPVGDYEAGVTDTIVVSDDHIYTFGGIFAQGDPTSQTWNITVTEAVEHFTVFFNIVPSVGFSLTGTMFDNAAALVNTTADGVHAVWGAIAAGDYTLVIESSTGVDYNGEISTVPVPAALILFGSALLGFAGVSTRRKAA